MRSSRRWASCRCVFGSVTRGEAGPESDVDLLVELDPERRISLLGFILGRQAIEDMLECRVDLIASHGVRPEFREEVLREAVEAA